MEGAKTSTWVALVVLAVGCGDLRPERPATTRSELKYGSSHNHQDAGTAAADAGSSSSDAGVPAPYCGLPVDAFLANWRAGAPGHKDSGLSLGKASRRLFLLLDQLDSGQTPTGFSSLQGLTLTKKRMTVVAAAISVTRKWPGTSGKGNEPDDCDYRDDDDDFHHGGADRFTVNCLEVERLAGGGPKSVLEVARAVNVAAGAPVPASSVGTGPFGKGDLVWEVAAANEHGEGLHAHHHLVTQASTVVANPVKQLFEGFIGALNAKERTHQGSKKLWLAVANTQAGLDALMHQLGGGTPPPAPVLAAVASPTSANPIVVSGTATAGTTVHVTGGAAPAQVLVSASGQFSLSVALTPNATNHLSAFAQNAFGDTSASVAFDVLHDSLPPSLAFVSPTNLEVLTHASVRTRLHATDALPVASVSVNGVPATLVAGVWEATVGLPLGDSFLVATAADALGNTATVSIGVTYVVAEGAGFISAATGGTVLVPLDGGSPLAGSFIVIPPNALPADSLVTLTLPEDGGVRSLDIASAVGLPIELQPSGVAFATPVQVGLRYNPSLVRVLQEVESGVELFTLGAAGWSAVPSTVNTGQHLVLASVSHFSLYQAGTKCLDCLKAEVVAGDPTSTDFGDGAAATVRMNPWWLSPMATGPMLVLDTYSSSSSARVRRLGGAQVVTVAGKRAGGSTADGALAVDAELQNAYVVAQNPVDGTVYFATVFQPALVRKFKPGGAVETVAGSGATPLVQVALGASYPAKSVDLQEIRGLVVGPAGELYISSAEALLQLQGGGLSLIAGGNACAPCDPSTTSCAQCRALVEVQEEIRSYPNGVPAANARLVEQTQGLVSMSARGQLLFFTNAVSGVRVLNLAATSVTLYPEAATSDCGAQPIVVGPQRVKTIAGIKRGVGDDGDGASAVEARFNAPTALSLDADGNLYVSDTSNHSLRVIGGKSGCVSSFARTALHQLSASAPITTWEQLAPSQVIAAAPSPAGIALSTDGELFVAMTGWKTVVKIHNANVDGDALVNEFDLDDDNDLVLDVDDNCPLLAGAPQTDSDGDGVGDACDACPFDAANDADKDGVCSTLGLRLQLPRPDPTDNLLVNASAQFPADPSIVAVSAADFAAALEGVPLAARSSFSLAALDIAYAAGERANDAWTGGLIGHAPAGPGTVTANVFAVVSDPHQALSGELLATSYFIAPITMTMATSWSARSLSFGQVPTPGGSANRCCGKPQTCATDSRIDPPGCPGGRAGLCGETTLVPKFGSGVAEKVAVRAYNAGVEIDAHCFPPVDKYCAAASFVCDPQRGFDFSQTTQVEVPFGNDCHGGTFSRVATGRAVPKLCTFADSAGQSASAEGDTFKTGGSPAPECDGQCFECAGGSAAGAGVPQVPRQCALMKVAPGSGVCSPASAGELARQQAEMLLEVGPLGPGQTRESCHTAPRVSPVSRFPSYQCTVCGPSGCHQTVRPSPINPIANADPDCSASSQTRCGATSDGVGTGSGASGSAAGGGTVVAAEEESPKTLEQAPPVGPKDPSAVNPPNKGERPADGPTPSQVVAQHAAKAEDPILLGDGSFELDHVDLSFPGPVRSLEFSRSYNSRSRGRSELGSNWSHNWDVRVVALNDTNRPDWVDPFCAGSPLQTTCVMLHTGDTQRLFSRDPTSGLFVPQAGVMSTLVEKLGGGWMLRTPDGHVSTFDADGLMVRDEDRFGNAFFLDWEPNAWGLAFDAICPREPTRVDSSGNYVDTLGPGGRYSSASSECVLLSGLTGRHRPLLYGPNAPSTLALNTGSTSRELADAVDLLVALQTGGGRKVGSGSPWGARFARVKRVRDGTGRALDFEYFPDTDRTALPTGPMLRAGLLKAVAGPAGARIEFSYDAPAGHPAHLNEVFLVAATRVDSTTIAGLEPTPVRAQRFTYAWSRNAIRAADVNTARQRYSEFLAEFLNCSFHSVGECGQPFKAGFTLVDTGPQLEEHAAALASDVADNIIAVTNAGVVESETRYETNVFSRNFDRATRQRWGSTFTSPSPATGDFSTTLPEAQFDYSEAGALPGGTDDSTTAFLESSLSSRYPLEAVDLAAKVSAEEKGMLLAADSPSTAVVARGLPAIAEGELLTDVNASKPPACHFGALPARRSRTAGYQPSLDYFDTVLPAAPNADAPTAGVDLDMALKRSRLSCDMLARAQTWDARHNDLQWTWAKPSFGDYVSTRILDRRAHMNANANRICGWTRLLDRDGDTHVYGLNYHGRVLVDAVKVGAAWKFAETLYNADGNVISQRRTLPESQTFSAATGDTRYSYLELESGRFGLSAALPSFWSRRGNVARIIQRPKGGTVADEVEGAPGVTQTSRGRYATYEYEPFFNQVRKVVSGSIDASGNFVPTLTTSVVFDYQELSLTDLTPLLEHLQAFGFGFPVDARGSLALTELEAQLPVAFGLGDVNGDAAGVTRLGLPVRVTNEGGAQREFTLYRWNPSARPYFVLRPDGSAESMLYLPPGALSGTADRLNAGFLGAVRHLPRREWPATEGPGRLPCPDLKGPYQWLLPAGCSAATLASDLATELKLPLEAAQAIVQQQAQVDATTSYAYFPTGHTQAVTRPDGAKVEYTRDLDGRVREEKLLDVGGGLHSLSVTTYDTLMRPASVQRFGASSQNLGSAFQEWDEEGNLLYQCAEDAAGGCARAGHGALPTTGTSSTFWYSPGGSLRRSQDAEGATTDYFRDARKWVTRTALSATGEVTRGTLFTYDDDGQILSTLYGQEFTGLLSEVRAYDGLSRLKSLTDTEGRSFELGTSRRELTARVDLLHPSGGAPLWRMTYRFDELGRAVEESTNGIVTREVVRRAGGAAYKSRSVGQRWMFTTLNAEGIPVYEEDEGGEVMTVRTAVPGSRLVTASSISKSGNSVLTSSVVRHLDVLGDVVLETETGAGTGATQGRLSRDTDFVRNAAGFVNVVYSADGAQTENVFDFLGRLKVKKQLRTLGGGFDETGFTYDRRGALLTLKDPGNQTTTQSYTGFGEPKTRTSPGTPSVIAGWTYDVLGRVETEALGSASLSYAYEAATGRLQNVFAANGALARTYAWDELGRLQKTEHRNLGLNFTGSPVPSSSRTVFTSLTYDALGRVALETSKVGQRVERKTGSTWTLGAGWTRAAARPDGTSSTEVFDTLGRLATMARPSGRTTGWDYQGGLETRVSSETRAGSPLRRTTDFDGLGQALTWRHTAVDIDSAGQPLVASEGDTVCPLGWNFSCGAPVQAISVLRDKVGRVASFSSTVARPNQTVREQWRGFTYDAMGRVTAVLEAAQLPTATVPPTHTLSAQDVTTLGSSANAEVWSYAREAAVGSLLSITRTTAGAAPRFTSPVRGAGHQLTKYSLDGASDRLVAHDNSGRVGADGARTYGWDDFSALVTVKDSGVLAEALQYDGLGRLVARWNSAGLVEELAYDGAQMVASFDDAQAVKWSASWAPGLDALLSISDSSGEYLALDDGKANVSGFVRADDSQLAGAAEYTPEGRATWRNYANGNSCAETGTSTCAPLLGLPFGFHGAFKSSGTGLVYFRNRWYSTEAGQWLSQDPLGYVDSFNAYAFNRFDPVNFVDPWGLASRDGLAEAPATGPDFTYLEVQPPTEVIPPPGACDAACQQKRQERATQREENRAARSEGGRPASEPSTSAPAPRRPLVSQPKAGSIQPPRHPTPQPAHSSIVFKVRRVDANGDPLRNQSERAKAIDDIAMFQMSTATEFVDAVAKQLAIAQAITIAAATGLLARASALLGSVGAKLGKTLGIGEETLAVVPPTASPPVTPLPVNPPTTRVGRWMADAEAEAMVETGKVQAPLNGAGATHVTVPPDAAAFSPPTQSTAFVEFDVPTGQLRIHDPGKGWGRVFGPGSLEARSAAARGLPAPTTMPPATNIRVTKP